MNLNHAESLAKKWGKFVALPWPADDSPAQRAVFAAYEPSDERQVLANLVAFETAATSAGHAWTIVDLEPLFAKWLAASKYREDFFADPSLLDFYLRKFAGFLAEEAERLAGAAAGDAGAVVALTGAGALFGLASVKTLVDALVPRIAGRLLVFFPGTCEDNNYRLLNGHDGWGYLATVLNV